MVVQQEHDAVRIPAAGVAGRISEFLAGLARNRALLWGTALAFICLIWMIPRLPMVDLLQHAGQIALWRDLINANTPWGELLRVNLGTPYLLGYAVALPFSYVMLPGTAVKLVLSATVLAYIAAAIALRKEACADERLDWLALPSIFGFSWQWGFYSFLVVTPLIVVLVHMSVRYARQPTVKCGAALIACGVVLMLGHGMAFIFACAIGGIIVLAQVRSLKGLMLALIPFAILGGVFLIFLIWSSGFDTPVSNGRTIWGYSFPHLRLMTLFVFSHGFTGDLAPMSAMLLVVPFAMGLVFDRTRAVPFAALVAWTFLVPQSALGAGYFFERFGMLSMPFFILMWREGRPAGVASAMQNFAAAGLVASAWLSLGVMAVRFEQFAREAADFEVVLAEAQPGKRAIGIYADVASPAAGHGYFYMHYANWYQSEKQGLVDFNFASFHNMVVRYRPEYQPAVKVDFEWWSHKVEWQKHNVRIYDYYFVRHGLKAIPAQLIDNGECLIERVAAAGAWTLLARGACKD